MNHKAHNNAIEEHIKSIETSIDEKFRLVNFIEKLQEEVLNCSGKADIKKLAEKINKDEEFLKNPPRFSSSAPAIAWKNIFLHYYSTYIGIESPNKKSEKEGTIGLPVFKDSIEYYISFDFLIAYILTDEIYTYTKTVQELQDELFLFSAKDACISVHYLKNGVYESRTIPTQSLFNAFSRRLSRGNLL